MGVLHIPGSAMIVVVFMTYELRAPVAVPQMMELSLRLGTFLWSQLSCWLECRVGATPPNCQVQCPLFKQEKPLGAFL